jgi:hypothetical protein
MAVIFGLIFLIFGSWMIISPKSALDFKVGIARSMGAKISVSKKTVSSFRWLGVVVLAIGLILLL